MGALPRTPSVQPGCRAAGRPGCPPALRGLDPLQLTPHPLACGRARATGRSWPCHAAASLRHVKREYPSFDRDSILDCAKCLRINPSHVSERAIRRRIDLSYAQAMRKWTTRGPEPSVAARGRLHLGPETFLTR